MKLFLKNQAIQRKNSEVCVVTEYEIGDPEIDFAAVTIAGRYPSEGRVTNKRCKEIVYVQEGAGKVEVNEKEYRLNAGNLMLIEANEKFYWEGHMTLFISCHPAFTVEQHQKVD